MTNVPSRVINGTATHVHDRPTFRPTAPRTPATRPNDTVYYTQANPHGGVITYTHAELTAKRAQDKALYARWKQRQDQIAAKDRKSRSFLLGLGAAFGIVFLAVIGVGIWAAITLLAAVSWPVVAGAGLLLACGAGVVGHRCVTIVQHHH